MNRKANKDQEQEENDNENIFSVFFFHTIDNETEKTDNEKKNRNTHWISYNFKSTILSK